MASNQNPHFTFTVSSLPQDTFQVVRFSGAEGLSRLFQFEITLISRDKNLDFQAVLQGSATLTVKRPQGGDVSWHGQVRDFQQSQAVGDHAFCRAVLVPKAWQASITRSSQVYLNRDMPQFIKEALSDAGLSPNLDFEVRATKNYANREFVIQYNESHFAFVSRWMERNGAYFFFDHSGQGDKLTVVDTADAHASHPGGDSLTYAQPSGLGASTGAGASEGLTGKAVRVFHASLKRTPGEVMVKDYNYRTPNLAVEATHQVSPRGSGRVYVHGGHLRSVNHADKMARVQAEALACRERLYLGESDAPFVQPGYIFELKGHYRQDCNQRYLTLEVKHEGSQEGWLSSGLGLAEMGDKLFYRNSFAAIPAATQYRGEARTPTPRIEGALKAVIDASGSGEYAQLDEHGRYKVILPFDLSGRKDGQASTWLRMLQPYVGENHGLHLPLHKGTEVALIFVEGDPDQPVIAGAVPNPATPSVVTDSNQTTARLLTAGGNALNFQDQQGQEQMLLSSPQMQTSVSLGAPMAQASASSASALASAQPSAWQQAQTVAGYNLYTNGMFAVQAQLNFEMILGMSTQIIGGALNLTCFGANDTVNFGGVTEINFTTTYEFYLLKRETCINEGKTAETEERMVEQVSELLGDRSTLAESIENIVNEKINVLATKDEVADQVTSVFQGAQNIFATRSELVESQETILSAVAETIAEETSTLASKEEVAASLTTTVEAMSAVVSTQEQMAGTIEVMSTSIQNLAAEMNFVTTEMNMV